MECKQKDCKEEARFVVYWPPEHIPSCEEHTKRFRVMARVRLLGVLGQLSDKQALMVFSSLVDANEHNEDFLKTLLTVFAEHKLLPPSIFP